MFKINSPNVVRLYDACVTAYHYNLLMEFCNGGDLKGYIKARGGYLAEEEARLILRQIVVGVSDIKTQLVMHRDLKPANILLHFSDIDQSQQICISDKFLQNLDFRNQHKST